MLLEDIANICDARFGREQMKAELAFASSYVGILAAVGILVWIAIGWFIDRIWKNGPTPEFTWWCMVVPVSYGLGLAAAFGTAVIWLDIRSNKLPSKVPIHHYPVDRAFFGRLPLLALVYAVLLGLFMHAVSYGS